MGSPRVAVPKPGPAQLTSGAGLDEWLEEAKQCHYLPEPVMKELCEMVKEVLMEGKFEAPLLHRIAPVSSYQGRYIDR